MGLPTDFLHPPGQRERHAPDGSSAPSPPAFRWVPIRSLGPRHRERIREHLLALTPADRYLRFGHPASDAQIGHYVDRLDFERDEVFGIFNRRLELLAMAHLAVEDSSRQPGSAEFGVSVSTRARGRGYGSRLFDRAVLLARNRGVQSLIIYALAENSAMLRIVRKAGGVVVRDGGEAQGTVELDPVDLASRIEELVEEHAAEIDYGWKRSARTLRVMLDATATPEDDAH